MSLEIGWRKLLEDNLPNIGQGLGDSLDYVPEIDLNGNGLTEPNEIIDDMTTGADREPYYIDEAEAKEFCIRNRDVLADKIEFLKVGRDNFFSADNPINSLILYEFQLLEPYYNGNARELVMKAYADMALIRNAVLGYEMTWGMEHSTGMHLEPEPRDKMLWVRQSMIDTGILFELGGSILLIENFSTQRKLFDCVSAFTLIAISHEFGWDVNAFLAPYHIGERWDNVESGNFEIASGEHFDNDFYIHYGLNQRGAVDSTARRNGRRIEQISIDEGAYLKTLSSTELDGIFYYNIGQAISIMTSIFGDQFANAVDAYDESLRRYPQNAMAHAARGLAEIELNQWDEALADFLEAARLDPNLAASYEGLGKVYIEKGDFGSAVESLETAIELDDTVSARINCGVAQFRLALVTEDATDKRHLLRDALRNYRRALRMDPGNEAATFNIEVVQSILGGH